MVTSRTCQNCQAPLQGRAQKWCDACRPGRSNRRTLAEAARKRGDEERAQAILQRGKTAGGTDADPEGWGALLYAAALTATDDRRRAARIAGVTYSPELDAQAREEWGDLIAQRAEGMQRLGYMLMTQALARLGPAMASMPVGQLGSTAKAVVDALERLQTAIKPTFGDVTVVLDTSPLEDE